LLETVKNTENAGEKVKKRIYRFHDFYEVL